MKTSTKNTIIKGSFAALGAIIGIIGTKGYMNTQQQNQLQNQEQTQKQSIIVNIDGKEVSYQSKDVESLNDTISKLEKENDKLKTNNKSLEDQNTNLSNENSRLLESKNELENKNETLTSAILEYQNNSNNASNDLSQIINEDSEYRSFLSECLPYSKTDYVTIIENNIKMCGVSYSNGLKFYCDGHYALFNLAGKYNKIKFDIGHIDDTVMEYGEVHIYVDKLDSNPVKIIPVDPEGMVETYEIELNGAKQLKIATVADRQSIGVGIVNIEVK